MKWTPSGMKQRKMACDGKNGSVFAIEQIILAKQ
jgi:hypothetical protein